MAVGYQYRTCENFPVLTNRFSDVLLDPQSVLIGNGYEPAQTTMRYVAQIGSSGYFKYSVTHETVRKMQVRFGATVQKQVIEQLSFPMFLAPNRSHAFVQTTAIITSELFKRASETYPRLSYGDHTIDLKRLNRESGQHISGGWFRDLQIADVSAAALFGAEVSHSDDWERYSDVGTISVLQMNYTEQISSYKVSVNRNGGIVIFNKMEDEDRLKLLVRLLELVSAYIETQIR